MAAYNPFENGLPAIPGFPTQDSADIRECPVNIDKPLGNMKRPATNSPELAKVFELVARYFSMLSDTTRLKILHYASQGERSVTDIIEAVNITQTNASRHLALLHQAGLVRRRRVGKRVLYWTRDPELIKVCCHGCAHMIHKIKSEGTLQQDWLAEIETAEKVAASDDLSALLPQT
jgi:DNA-binding transcriptional ArsR family regulator